MTSFEFEEVISKCLGAFILILIGFSVYLMAMIVFTPKELNVPKEFSVHSKTPLVNVITQGTTINVAYNLHNVNYEEINLDKITITSYNNEVKQTDNTPNIMASNRLVYEGAVAISRDLKTKYNLKWGDLIYIDTLQRYFVIEDLMNERFKNRIDIFSFDKEWSLRLHLKSQRITIYKIKRG